MLAKTRILFICVLIIALTAGCSAPRVAETPVPATETRTPTQPPTATAEPTATATATAVPSPTPVPLPDPFNLDNASQLEIEHVYGNGMFRELTWMPDGSSLLVVRTTALVMLSGQDGKTLWEVELPAEAADAAITRDGKKVISATAGGTLHTWDAASGEYISEAATSQKALKGLSLSPYGKYLAVVDYLNSTQIFDTEKAALVSEIKGDAYVHGVGQVSFSPDETHVLIDGWDSNENRAALQWDVETGKFLNGLPGLPFNVWNFSYTADGSMILGARSQQLTQDKIDTVLTLWAASDGKLISSSNLPGNFPILEADRSNETVYAVSENGIFRYSLKEGEQKSKQTGHKLLVTAVSEAPDGKLAASVSCDGKLIVWNPQDGETFWSVVLASAPRFGDLAVSPDGAIVAASSPGGNAVELWDRNGHRKLDNLVKGAQLLYTRYAFSDDGTLLAALGKAEEFGEKEIGTLFIWDVKDGKLIKEIPVQHRFRITLLKFSPDNQYLASLGIGETLVWDIQSGEQKFGLGGYYTMDFSPDSKILANDSVDFGLYLVDMATGRRLATVSGEYIFDIAFAPDGKNIAVAGFKVSSNIREHKVLIYPFNVETKKRGEMRITDHLADITRLAYSPDGKMIASVDGNGDLVISNAETGEMLKRFKEVTRGPHQVVFSADGRYLMLAGGDGSLYNIHLPTGK